MRLTLTLAAASGSSVALSVATARMSARLPMGPVDGLLWYSWTAGGAGGGGKVWRGEGQVDLAAPITSTLFAPKVSCWIPYQQPS